MTFGESINNYPNVKMDGDNDGRPCETGPG